MTEELVEVQEIRPGDRVQHFRRFWGPKRVDMITEFFPLTLHGETRYLLEFTDGDRAVSVPEGTKFYRRIN